MRLLWNLLKEYQNTTFPFKRKKPYFAFIQIKTWRQFMKSFIKLTTNTLSL